VGRAPANFRQVDVTKAINAAKRAGLDVVRVEVDPKTAKITVIVKDGEETKTVNPFDTAPVPQSRPKRTSRG